MRVRPFLHRLSLENAEAELIPTTAELLRKAAFIDGRTEFACEPPKRVPLQRFLADEAARSPPLRIIFHIGFCGSTLLARLLDIPGRSLLLREPNCLADLANQYAANKGSGKAGEQSAEALAAAGRHLSRPWSEHEPVAIKASNWVNNLLPLLLEQPAHPLFLISSRRRFVTAVLRGGPARVAFVARAAVHLSSGDRKAAELVASALYADGDKDGQLARLAATAHEIQMRQFRAAADKGGWGAGHWLDQAELSSDPVRAAGRAAAALELQLPSESIEANVSAWAGRHAKQPSESFSYQEEAAAAAAVEAAHGAVLERALDWASRTFEE